MTTIGPFLRDMSSSSSLWWDEVLRVAGALYRVWLESEPMERLRLMPVSPPAFQVPPWLRIEQRGSVALLKALPESLRSELVAQREVSSIGIMFKVLRVYQPGGLGERTTLLKQLVDQKVPSPLSEWMVALRSWRRWLTRVQELGIQPPDPVLLLSTLDRFAAGLARHSPQVAFRLQITRAALRVDTAPTERSIHQFSESLLAEGEAVFHGGSSLPIQDSVKVKALGSDPGGTKEEVMKKEGKEKSREVHDGKDVREGKEARGGKPDAKGSKGEVKPTSGEKPVCRYFISESGCKKGQKCTFPHEWKGISKMGRCWNCGSSQHMKADCPVKETPRVKKEGVDEKKGKETDSKQGESLSSSSTGAILFHPPADPEPAPAEALVKEAVQLLKSLRPAMKAVTVCAVKEGKGHLRALLDGGATHILRPAKTKAEFEKAVPIKVELAAGVATLRQVQTTGTLVTDFDTQLIVPLGKVVKLGYRVTWEGEQFEMVDPTDAKIDVELEAGCPTVDLKTAQRLIEELEEEEMELDRRVRALRAGDPGDLSPNIWRWLVDLRKMWPEVPDELLARVVPSGRWSGESVPFNRHQRKRLFSADSVVLHLFSGPDQAWWRKRLETQHRAVVCVDKMVDPAQDLLSDQLASFLADLCERGSVDVILGGPPCRTVSKLRFRQPGPPPLRARSGPERFALEALSDVHRDLAWNDAVLWMRQLWLYALASAARTRLVLFLKEHPRDPEEYKDSEDPVEYPSFFAWPEWRVFVEKYQIREVRLDLGALGHQRRKPTTLGTNLQYLHRLEGLRDLRRPGDHSEVAGDLGQRMSTSRSWAAWPESFKIEITKAILLELEGYQRLKDEVDDQPRTAKMTAEQWRQHVMNDHLPYSRECSTCLTGSGRSRPRKRVQHPDALTLSVDICGPFRPGHDRRAKAKYFMVGVFSIPVRKVEGKVTALPLSLEETLGGRDGQGEPEGEELLPALEDEVREEAETEDGDAKALEEWMRLEVEAEEIEIQNYTMVETLASRQVAEVKACLARMIARLKYLGLEVRRVHSDAAGEMRGTRQWCHDRGLYRTFTCGSDWKANGRAEAEIGVIRRAINTLIRSSGDGEDYWPLMAKHVGERRGRQQLGALGFVTPQLLPWGQQVMVTAKGWDDFQGHWRARKKPGKVRGPDPDMSLTSGGHLVEVEDGKFIRTDDLVRVGEHEVTDVVELKIRDQPTDLLDKTVRPKRRLTEKTSLAMIGGGEIQRRLVRGQEWANQEFKHLEACPQKEAGVALVAEMDMENDLMESFLQESAAVVRRLEADSLGSAAEEEELFLQTKTIGLNEVRKTLPLWIPPLKEEIGNFDSNQAIQRVTEEEAMGLVREAENKGQRAEIIPGMGVFTRKAGDGRRRARIVCCGNYMESRTGDEVYASGADATQLRATLRVASLHNWQCLSLDVKSAFLLAPKAQGELVIVRPPKILVEASLAQPGEHWVITSAMYGLVTSPKDWSVYRDSELQKMEGKVNIQTAGTEVEEVSFGFRQLKDANLWAIQEFSLNSGVRTWGAVLGYMIVYVDDVLMVGPKEVTDKASQTIQRIWKTSNPEYAAPGGAPMRFLGIEIQRFQDGMYYLHQGSYVREVLERHEGEGMAPFIKVPEEKEEGAPSLARVKEAQKITGELLWLSGRTRPDIAWAVMSQWAVKRPEWTLLLGRAILAYVRGTKDFGLRYPVGVPLDADPDLARSKPRKPGTIEVLVDASFSPGDSHSVSGTIILLAGCPIQWESKKQSLMALSTAEAELSALIEGLQAGRSVRALIELLLDDVSLELYNDNRAAVVLAAGTGGGWRTRHLRIRAHCLAEAIKMGESSLNHRPGSSLWADALTKSLPPQSLERFCQGVFLCQAHQSSEAKKKVLERGESGGVSRCMAMMLAGVSLLPVGQASEVCEKGESDHEQKSGTFGDLGWLIFLAGLVCLLHLIKDIGFGMIQRLLSGREEVKVKLLTEKGFCSPLRSMKEMDDVFGEGGWRAVERFLITQPDGKQRAIDNARKGGHNHHTTMPETISTVNVDFVAALARMVDSAFALDRLPPPCWLDLRLGTDDLPDAYRGLPVCDEHLRYSNVAIYVPDQGWRFTTMYGLAYGLESAVVNFNRFPQLGVAIVRRCLLGFAAAYFDDELAVDFIRDHDVSQVGLQLTFQLLGAPPQPAKSFAPGHNRHYLGTSVHVGDFVTEGLIRFQPKFSTSTKILKKLRSALETSTLSPDDAGKLRGDLNWMFSMCAGYAGRIGGPLLAAKQKAVSADLSMEDCLTLRLLAAIVACPEPRVISIRSKPAAPLVIYSDASFENDTLRLGWVIIWKHMTPSGVTCTVPQRVIDTWQPRTQQIYPGETLCGLLVPWFHGAPLAGYDVLWFVDNEAAVASLIKGGSSQADVHTLVQLAHYLLQTFRIRVWFEWIDSHSNPSDGLSRAGLDDTWTQHQAWHLFAFDFPSALEQVARPEDLSSFLPLWTVGVSSE